MVICRAPPFFIVVPFVSKCMRAFVFIIFCLPLVTHPRPNFWYKHIIIYDNVHKHRYKCDSQLHCGIYYQIDWVGKIMFNLLARYLTISQPWFLIIVEQVQLSVGTVCLYPTIKSWKRYTGIQDSRAIGIPIHPPATKHMRLNINYCNIHFLSLEILMNFI